MKRWLALGLGLAIGLLAFLPVRLFLPAPPLAARSVDGSLWRASLAEARLGPAALGDVALAWQPGRLLRGEMAWTATGQLNGLLWRSASAAGVSGLAGRVAVPAIGGLPLAGLSLADVSLALDGRGRCRAASGQLVADLAVPLAGQRQLAGALACENGTLRLALASGDGRLRLDLAGVDGGWQSRVMVAGIGPAEAMALAAAGFHAEAGAQVKEERGPW